MAKTKCAYGKRGKSTIEFYKCDKPQRYCYGWEDAMTGEAVKECENCPKYYIYAQRDLEEWLANGNCTEVQ